ncbi:MAG: PQQ-dependent sugar dehydrogenase, partial [Bacteroidota bacterium]
EGMFEPMEMELLPDGRPIWIQRRGEIMVYDPEFEATTEVAKMDVWTEFEDGLLGVALDPDFVDNNWLYLYYSPNGEESINQLSRFKWTGNTVDKGSEQKILAVPVDRNECCHSGGSVEFGPTGLLYLSVGDNTNPFDSDGYAPIDDSKKIPNFDARRSASNTDDLRGKVLRIKVEEDGSYSIPEGNLFANGEGGRPEIYVMGCRNPFRISIDQKSQVLYWGDIGPDAGKDSLAFGPKGHCEVNYAPTAGYYGWPLFVADNKAYNRRDFKTGKGGEAFDPQAPVNESKFNSGAKELPPARPAMVFYPYDESPEFPQVGKGGRNPMAGPVYHADMYPETDNRFPAYYDGKFFFYEWMRDWIMAGQLDEEGKVVSFEPFLPGLELLHPMDMMFGPDGDLYILEYGKLWFKRNDDARLLRIRFNGGNRPPVPAMEIAEQIGAAPFQLTANIGESIDYDDDELSVTWWLDGKQISSGEELNYIVKQEGVQTLTMQLDDGQGNIVTEEAELIVGNSMPEVALNIEGNRSFFFPGQHLVYSVNVKDAEDGTLSAGVDPEAVTVSLDFLEGEDLIVVEYGHQMATEETQHILGQKLIANSDCSGCHQEQEASIGPSYLEVGQKYRSQTDAVSYLSNKIINGGGGVWGEQAMAAHPQITSSQAEQMANYILALAGPPPAGNASLPIAGKQKLDQHRMGVPGRYYFQATYTDQGGGDGIPRLTARETAILQAPYIMASKVETSDEVLPYTIEAGQVPGITEDLEILVGMNDGWAGYGEFDLTAIQSIAVNLFLTPGITSGGTIELVVDDPLSGQVVGKGAIEQGPTTVGPQQLTIALEPTSGIKPLYFRFEANSDEGNAVMGAIVNYEFKLGDLSR